MSRVTCLNKFKFEIFILLPSSTFQSEQLDALSNFMKLTENLNSDNEFSTMDVNQKKYGFCKFTQYCSRLHVHQVCLERTFESRNCLKDIQNYADSSFCTIEANSENTVLSNTVKTYKLDKLKT